MPVSAPANGSYRLIAQASRTATSAATMHRHPSGSRLSSCRYMSSRSSNLTEGTRLPQTKQDTPAVSVGR